MSDTQHWIAEGAAGTQALAHSIGERAPEGLVIGLVGELGAGKTTFVQGLAAGLQVPEETAITSPTFAIANCYEGGRCPLTHVDAYRIVALDELPVLGADEWLDGSGITAIEWADRIRPVLPSSTLWCHIEHQSEASRRLIFSCDYPLQNWSVHSILCGAADAESARVVKPPPMHTHTETEGSTHA